MSAPTHLPVVWGKSRDNRRPMVRAWRVRAAVMVTCGLLVAVRVAAQDSVDTLSGAVTDTAGKAVPNATVSIKNVVTGQVIETRTDSAGAYRAPNLEPGKYEVSASASGFKTSVGGVTIAPGTNPTANLQLTRELSVTDLGFSEAQTQGSTVEQARLDKRSHMLKMHQRLGLITTVPLIATIFTGLSAGGRSPTSTDRDMHAALGVASVGMYFATASFAVFAPKVPGVETRGQIRLHKALAWIHGPGMILTPILGAMAFAQKSEGRHVEGIASEHGTVAIVTASAYGAAILSVSIKF